MLDEVVKIGLRNPKTGFHQISVNGEQLIPFRDGAALIASKASPVAWHAVRPSYCDCDGFTFRGTCRHIKALAAYLKVAEPIAIDDGESIGYHEWRERRAS